MAASLAGVTPLRRSKRVLAASEPLESEQDAPEHSSAAEIPPSTKRQLSAVPLIPNPRIISDASGLSSVDHHAHYFQQSFQGLRARLANVLCYLSALRGHTRADAAEGQAAKMSDNLRKSDTRAVVTEGLAEGTSFDYFACGVDDKGFRSSPAFIKAKNDIRLLYKAVRLVEGSVTSAKRQAAAFSSHITPLARSGAPNPSFGERPDPLREADVAPGGDGDSLGSSSGDESESGSPAASPDSVVADGEEVFGDIAAPAPDARGESEAFPVSSCSAAAAPAALPTKGLAAIAIPQHFYSMPNDDRARVGNALDAVTLTSGEELPFEAAIARNRYEQIREAWVQARRLGTFSVVPWMNCHAAGATMQQLDLPNAFGRTKGRRAPASARQPAHKVAATAASARTLSAVSVAKLQDNFHEFMADNAREQVTWAATLTSMQATEQARRNQILRAQSLQDRRAAREGKFAVAILQAACRGEWDSLAAMRELFLSACGSAGKASERLIAALEFCSEKEDSSLESNLELDRDLVWVMQLLGETIRPEIKSHFRNAVCAST